MCILRWRSSLDGVPRGEGVLGALCFTDGKDLLSFEEARGSIEATGAPHSVLSPLAGMGWTQVSSAEALRLDWIMSHVLHDVRIVPGLCPSEDVWNVPILGDFVRHVLPIDLEE